jgi:hypothetical protein
MLGKTQILPNPRRVLNCQSFCYGILPFCILFWDHISSFNETCLFFAFCCSEVRRFLTFYFWQNILIKLQHVKLKLQLERESRERCSHSFWIFLLSMALYSSWVPDWSLFLPWPLLRPSMASDQCLSSLRFIRIEPMKRLCAVWLCFWQLTLSMYPIPLFSSSFQILDLGLCDLPSLTSVLW